MLRLFFVLAFASASLHAQSLQAQLEVNLGAISIDSYDGVSANTFSFGVTSGPNIPACSFTGPQSNYRTCVQYVLSQYSQQGVVGVRIQFGMNGEAGSTPFLNQSGTIIVDPVWLSKFALFMQDLRAANLRYVALSPSWAPWGTGNMSIYACISGSQGAYRYDFTCTSNNANAVFYPWLPWAMNYTPNVGQGGAYDDAGPQAYNYAPQLGDPAAPLSAPKPWLWTSTAGSSSQLFKFWDGIATAIANAQLQVREVDIFPEIPMYLSSLYARVVMDNIQRVSPLDVINQILQAHQLSPTATISTAAFQPRNSASCTALSGDSELVVNAYLLLSAMTTGHFGRIPFDSTGDVCGPISPSDDVYGLSTSATNVIDIHTYPADAVFDNGWGWIDNPNVSGSQRYPDGAPVTNSPLGCAGTGCVQNNSNDVDAKNVDPANPGVPSGSSRTAANQIYTAINSFVGRWQRFGQIPSAATVIIGETDQYNPGGVGRDGLTFPPMTDATDCTTYGSYGSLLGDQYADPRTGVVHYVNFWCTPDWRWHRPWSTISSSENAAGFTDPVKPTGLNRSGVVMRPWAPMNWGTVLTPAPLSGSADRPYNVGGCRFSITNYNATVSGFGGPVSFNVTPALTSNCQWSIGPVTPQFPSLQPLAWPADGSGAIVTGAVIAGGSPCAYPPSSGGNACWTSGAATVTLQLAANPGSSPRSFSLNIAGTNITFTQSTPGLPSPPIGLTPADGATGVSTSSTLTWTAAPGASSYILYFQNNPGVPLNATTYSPGTLAPDTTYTWSVAAVNSFGSTSSTPASFTTAPSLITGLEFFPVPPCRVADTRPIANFPTTFGAPTPLAGQTRTFPVPSSPCGIPSNASAYSLNVTAVPPPSGYLGLLTTYPTGQARPNVSTLNAYTGAVTANAAIVPAGSNGSIDVYVSDKTDVLLDINGYFAPPASGGIQFYPLSPCRVADTRTGANFPVPFGGPRMLAGETRPFSVPSSPCGVPSNASAYSLNFTVVPPVSGYLGLLTTWPLGLARPNASTLNSYTGIVVANAAIVPAGNSGAIDVYVSDPTDVLFDINGYFGPQSTTGLNFYPVTPCRVADTRTVANFPQPFGAPTLLAGQTRTFAVPSSSCGIPSNAAAYSLNFTAVPPAAGYLGLLTTWPTGQPRPNASTLNSYLGTVVANAAIVPAGASGAINVYVSDVTDVIIDINGYFAK